MARIAITELVPPIRTLDQDDLRGIVGGDLWSDPQGTLRDFLTGTALPAAQPAVDWTLNNVIAPIDNAIAPVVNFFSSW